MSWLFNPAIHSVEAAGIESLVMPGKLIQGHAKYESECKRCHQPFSKESQDSLCLDCHEDVNGDVVAGEGFHGRALAGRQCRNCHDDHLGRDAVIVILGKETFDHEQTDYPLHGVHVRVQCTACHVEGKKYREASQACHSCHREDDAHGGKLGEKCDDCHNVKSWKKQDFDHNETEFPLHGKHAEVACNSCHAGNRYEGTPRKCSSCHHFNDVHAGRYGAECADCHSEKAWDHISFDHDTNTDYPLTGKHRGVDCISCHHGGSFERELPVECVSCHRDDDIHAGLHGEQCKSCHDTAGWDRVTFDHDRKTDFPLRGRHEELLCNACHRRDPGEENTGTGCHDCHRLNDVHAGKLGSACGQCHNEKGWGGEVRFDHDLTQFPLIGLHAVAPCEECHLTAVYSEAPGACNSCHQDDDVHQLRLGSQCQTCHNPNAWSLWEFDHDIATDFRLDGGHAGIDCHACHREIVRDRINLPAGCDNCHRQDDIHDGQFGRRCERCHNTESFDSAVMH